MSHKRVCTYLRLVSACLASALTASTATAQTPIFGTFSTSGVYDEQITDTSVIPGPSAAVPNSNALNAVDFQVAHNNITLEQLKLDISAAYDANKGGVISFDNDTNATSQVAKAFVALVGSNQGTLLTVERVLAPGQTGTDFGLNNNNDHSQVISGYNYLGIAGNSTQIRLNFSRPLETFAITALGRDGGRQMTLTILYDNATQEVYPNEVIGGPIIGDTLFAWKAPVGRSITSVLFNNSTFIRYDDMGVILANFQPGDVNGDLLVDNADYNLIRSNFGLTGATKAQGDVTGDGIVNLADFQLWKANEAVAATGASSAVPEPSGLALAAIGILAAVRRRRR